MWRNISATFVAAIALYAHFTGVEDEHSDESEEQSNNHPSRPLVGEGEDEITEAKVKDDDDDDEGEEEEFDDNEVKLNTPTWGFFADITPEVPKYSKVNNNNSNNINNSKYNNSNNNNRKLL